MEKHTTSSLRTIARCVNGFLPLLCAVLAFGANAQVIECIDGKGNSRYSETPCRADERDPRKIYRRGSANRKVESYDAYAQGERERLEQERETAARVAEEERRLKEMIRVQRLMQAEAAAALLNRLEAERKTAK
jgi:hypothetical protein